jgi:hypothetical protein
LAPNGTVGGLFADAAYADGVVYANGTDWPGLLAGKPPNRGILSAVAADGSHELWHFSTPFSPNISGVAVANGVVYFQSLLNGTFYALDAATGQPLAEVVTGGLSSGPAVSRGQIYLGTGDAVFPFLNPTLALHPGSIIALGIDDAPAPAAAQVPSQPPTVAPAAAPLPADPTPSPVLSIALTLNGTFTVGSPVPGGANFNVALEGSATPGGSFTGDFVATRMGTSISGTFTLVFGGGTLTFEYEVTYDHVTKEFEGEFVVLGGTDDFADVTGGSGEICYPLNQGANPFMMTGVLVT